VLLVVRSMKYCFCCWFGVTAVSRSCWCCAAARKPYDQLCFCAPALRGLAIAQLGKAGSQTQQPQTCVAAFGLLCFCHL
jgi:hypothetical protein